MSTTDTRPCVNCSRPVLRGDWIDYHADNNGRRCDTLKPTDVDNTATPGPAQGDRGRCKHCGESVLFVTYEDGSGGWHTSPLSPGPMFTCRRAAGMRHEVVA